MPALRRRERARGIAAMLVLLPLLCYALVFQLLWRTRPDRDPRHALMSAAIVWGVILVAITELLSLLAALAPPGLALGWGVAILIVLLAWARLKTVRRPLRPLGLAGASALDLSMVGVIIAVALLTGLIAAAGWPNSWDGMAYHLVRVAHWAQNASVAFYPTHLTHQLFYPPWAEYAMLHLTLLGGDERYANPVQWFSMLACLVGVSLIAGRLGASPRGQLFSAFFCATLPMGIVQASSVQNDYVLTFWLVCLAYTLLGLWARPTSIAAALGVGASLGLALATKGTAYILAAPLLLLLVRRADGRTVELRRLAVVGLVALAITTPHYLRNFELFGSPLGPVGLGAYRSDDNPMGLTNTSYSPRILASNLLRGAAVHLGSPFPAANAALEQALGQLHAWLGIGLNDRRSTWLDKSFAILPPSPHEAEAGNPFHLILLAAGTLVVASSARWRSDGRVRTYLLALVAGYVLLNLLLKWQPSASRFQLPLFVLGGALVGVVMPRHTRTLALATLVLAAWAVPFLLLNRAHPLLGADSVLGQPRTDQYFRQAPDRRPGYLGAVEFLERAGCADIGLLIRWGDLKFPFWALLPRLRSGGRLQHVAVANSSGRLAQRRPAFTPCAVVVVRGQPLERLEFGERVYRRAWEGRSVRVQVFLPDERSPASRAGPRASPGPQLRSAS